MIQPGLTPVKISGKVIDVLRLDQLPGHISGNKYYKLKYNIQEAKQQGFERIVSFGGAFSNHIHALAAATNEEGIASKGIIRGERVEPLNPTLAFAELQGMELQFVDRASYRALKTGIRSEEGFVVPEGGSNELGIKGASEILPEGYDVAICAVGTGGTMSGLVRSEKAEVWGVRVVNDDSLERFISNHTHNKNWRVVDGFEWGGYGKFRRPLIDWMKAFTQKNNMLLDPIYTGKLMYAVEQLVANDLGDARVLVVHSGGLQGIAGFNQRFGVDLPENI